MKKILFIILLLFTTISFSQIPHKTREKLELSKADPVTHIDTLLGQTSGDKLVKTITYNDFLNQLINSGIGTGGAGTLSPLTTKGDLYTYSTVNTRLPLGLNGQMLIVNTLEPTGLQWVNVHGSGDMLASEYNTLAVSGQVDQANNSLNLGGLPAANYGKVTQSNAWQLDQVFESDVFLNGSIDMQGNDILSVNKVDLNIDPTLPTHAVRLSYLDSNYRTIDQLFNTKTADYTTSFLDKGRKIYLDAGVTTVTLDDTGLTPKTYELTLFNNTGSNVTFSLASGDSSLQTLSALSDGQYAYVELYAANTWSVIIGGDNVTQTEFDTSIANQAAIDASQNDDILANKNNIDLNYNALLATYPKTVATSATFTLDNIGGDYANTASSTTSYTVTTNGSTGAFRKQKVNAASEPTVIGATKITGADFQANTDMDIVVYTPDGTTVEYYFLQRITTGGDTTPPTLVSATIEDASPTDVDLIFSESVTGTNLGWTLSGTTSTTFSSLTGSGTTWTGTLGTAAANGETITLSYNSGTGDFSDASSNPLATISSASVTNNVTNKALEFLSTQTDKVDITVPIDTAADWYFAARLKVVSQDGDVALMGGNTGNKFQFGRRESDDNIYLLLGTVGAYIPVSMALDTWVTVKLKYTTADGQIRRYYTTNDGVDEGTDQVGSEPTLAGITTGTITIPIGKYGGGGFLATYQFDWIDANGTTFNMNAIYDNAGTPAIEDNNAIKYNITTDRADANAMLVNVN